MKKSGLIIFLSGCFCLFQASCNNEDNAGTDEQEATPMATTPVTVTHPVKGSIADSVELNAISVYMLKTYAKANTTGYLQSSTVQMGSFVKKGQVLFSIRTKESAALGNAISGLDSSFHFQGITKLRSPGNGYITQLNYTAGNYVQEGDLLAEITDAGSFAFLLDLPYELRPYINENRHLHIYLPDNSVVQGTLGGPLPYVDSSGQTQRYIIRVNNVRPIPANLIAKVKLARNVRQQATLLPKEALLSNETQEAFWIMKMMNDSIAVKCPVQKGMENEQWVEIVEPTLGDSDAILLTGNYGLPDTARVKISHEH
jgi:multidrug efflux pump subunit AcrA (membrane-fusion protein)